MKLKFDIDCTPEELRSFFGLPDVKPMQDRLMAELEEQMRAGLKRARSRNHDEDLAARRTQGLGAVAGDVLHANGRGGAAERVAIALRTLRSCCASGAMTITSRSRRCRPTPR